MKHEVVAPSVGESVTEVSILKWAKPDGTVVKTGEMLLEVESDKATVEIIAEFDGQLKILKPAGERLPIGTLIATIDDSVKAAAGAPTPPPAKASAPSSPPSPAASFGSDKTPERTLSPAVQKTVTEKGLNPNDISGTGKHGMLTKGDVLTHLEGGGSKPASTQPGASAAPQKSGIPDRPGDRRVPMSMLRTKIAERLVFAQHSAAILTTFNEADMSAIMELRAKYKDSFKIKFGVSMGFMSFFVKASIEALKVVPEANASIDGHDTVYHDYFDVGVAVGTERGLVVPVVRGVDKLSIPQIEQGIGELALKARNGKLSIADMNGGTFTISNGGVYGSLLSTPILNPPQSSILGMHKIQDRPIVINGKIEARPMMYLALSYDHRLIDGKGAVTFLVTLKDFLENPKKLNLDFLGGL